MFSNCLTCCSDASALPADAIDHVVAGRAGWVVAACVVATAIVVGPVVGPVVGRVAGSAGPSVRSSFFLSNTSSTGRVVGFVVGLPLLAIVTRCTCSGTTSATRLSRKSSGFF